MRLTRIGYTQGKPGPDLTEIFLDANLIGDYSQIMHFINSLERDKIFFVVKQMNLTGQQGGVVNLRLQASTWMSNAAAAASRLPQANTSQSPPNLPGRRRRARGRRGGGIAMRLGTDKKGQLYLLIGLLVVLFGYGGYQMYKTFGGGSSYTPPPPAVAQYKATPPVPPRRRDRKPRSSPTPASIPRCISSAWRSMNRSSTRAPAATSSRRNRFSPRLKQPIAPATARSHRRPWPRVRRRLPRRPRST